jgi:hypothetical protein
MAKPKVVLSDDERTSVLSVIDTFHGEDQAVRERQILEWRRLKFLWEGISNIYYSAVAHDWRVWDQMQDDDSSDQDFYDKRINVFKAYLESIIAALSVVVPPIKCFPDDADNALDLSTAKAGDKIGELIYRHNDAPILWLHALFVLVTEGMVACYNYTDSDEEYGTYTKETYGEVTEDHELTICPNCKFVMDDEIVNPTESTKPEVDEVPIEMPDLSGDEELLAGLEQEFGMAPEMLESQLQQMDVCPSCKQMVKPIVETDSVITLKITNTTQEPKTRVKMGVYGGLNVKVPNYAKTQAQVPMLEFAEEINYVCAIEEFDHLDIGKIKKEITEKIKGNAGRVDDEWEQWGRLSPQYRGEFPENVVTRRCIWIRPMAFNCLETSKANALKKKFPDGLKVIMINDQFGCAFVEKFDEHWTLIKNPLSDYLHFTPLGESVTSIQEITNDLISLVIQTIEHGIGQTFADPAVLNFKAYQESEAIPGGVYPATPKSGKSVGDAFHEVKTATLSQEVLPFAQNVQQMGQLASGALPSLFGGSIEGSETASQYSMSRAQALQRLQNQWKMLCIWWKTCMGKAINQYIGEVQADERDVQRKKDGSFINVIIRKAELAGSIGKVELEANENLPITWSQQKDTIMQLLQSSSPMIQQFIMAPENLDVVREAIGLNNFFIPGEDDRNKQYEEINLLLNSKPMPNPIDPMMAQEMMAMGQPVEVEVSSIPVDEFVDNHVVQYEICRSWLISEAGRLAKVENPDGYKNVLLHAKEHLLAIDAPPPTAEEEQATNGKGAAPAEKPKKQDPNAPISGEGDVKTTQ